MSSSTCVSVPFFIRGELIDDPVVEFTPRDGEPFATPQLDLDRLVWSRKDHLLLAQVPVAEIIDVLVATGERLRDDSDGHLGAALDSLARTRFVLNAGSSRTVMQVCGGHSRPITCAPPWVVSLGGQKCSMAGGASRV